MAHQHIALQRAICWRAISRGIKVKGEQEEEEEEEDVEIFHVAKFARKVFTPIGHGSGWALGCVSLNMSFGERE